MASSWLLKLAFKCIHHFAWYANAFPFFLLHLPSHYELHANQRYPSFISFYFIGHLLLWCILCKFFIDLGCLVFASVLAIETDSYAETTDLISYWILLSLIYLFEYAFMRLLQW
ncbi:hypothetical protein MtrunA17_Chr4g0049691 [Medicago truncatula]|uniref:Transmembrane protein n=1 Tax=Medicago truncatula TaxID=3880 RepID=A0A396ICX9_MEDTR|nr:hypothetical protein MtrunA17_Chr4g0049691 [Medicago truncatula]